MREERQRRAGGIAIYDTVNPAAHGFFISLFLRAGSMYEGEGESGITHFLEHAAIRNLNATMGGTLYSTLDKYGLELNASTYGEMVQFYISGARENFRLGAEIITKVLSPITLSKSELSVERDRIKAEIRENDERGSLSSFTAAIVGEGTSLSSPITGTLGSVSKISGRRLEEYRRRVCTADNIFFYVTGCVCDSELDYLSELVAKMGLPGGEKRANFAPVPTSFGKRAPIAHIKSADFTMLRFTFDMDMTRVSAPEVDLIYDMLLSGYTSRFFTEMSEKRGLIYDLSGATERYRNIGFFTFSFEVRAGSVYEATELVFSILSDFCRAPARDEECMKAGYVDNAGMLYDDARELNFTLAYDNHIMDTGYRSLGERAEAYRKVTPDRLLSAAREIFRPENLTLTLKGSKKKIDSTRLAKIIEEFGKNDKMRDIRP